MGFYQGENVMFENIKNSSRTHVSFGDVVQLSKTKSKDPKKDGFERYIGLEHLEPSELKIRSWGNLSDGITFTNVFKPGQVLFGKRRAYQRKVAVADFSGVCSGDIYVLEPKDERILKELLPFICQSEPFYDYVISMSQGGLSPRVNWKALAKYEFAIPSLKEQRSISKVLRAAQRCKEKIVNAHVKLETLKISLIEDLMSRGITKRHKRFKKTEIGNLPFDWDVVSLESVLKKFQNGFAFSSRGYETQGIPIITMANISLDGRFQINIDKMRFWPNEKAKNLEQYKIDTGDLLIAMTDVTPDQNLIGRMAMVNKEGPFLLNQRVGHLIVKDNLIDRRFLMHLSQGSRWRRYAISHTGQGTQANLSTADIKSALIPLPSISEQIEISDYLSQIDCRLDDLKARGCKIDNLRKTFISEWLT